MIGKIAPRPSDALHDATRICHLRLESAFPTPRVYTRYAYKRETVAVLESNLEYTHSYKKHPSPVPGSLGANLNCKYKSPYAMGVQYLFSQMGVQNSYSQMGVQYRYPQMGVQYSAATHIPR